MDPNAWKSRKCLACGSGDYAFRSRKKIEPAACKGAAIETKYRCKACEHEWKERVAARVAES